MPKVNAANLINFIMHIVSTKCSWNSHRNVRCSRGLPSKVTQVALMCGIACRAHCSALSHKTRLQEASCMNHSLVPDPNDAAILKSPPQVLTLGLIL